MPASLIRVTWKLNEEWLPRPLYCISNGADFVKSQDSLSHLELFQLLIGRVQLNVPQPQDSFSERKFLPCTARGPAGS